MKYIVYLLLVACCQLNVYGQNFDIIWQQCYGGSEEEIVYDIMEIPDGYFITGHTWSSDGDVTLNKGLLDGWLIKTDTVGNILWEKTYGGSSGDGFRRIFPDNYGNYILVGGSGSSDGDISYDPYPDSEDFWIVKIDIDGNIIWDKIVGGSNGDKIWNASPTLDGGVVAVGTTYSNDGDVSVAYGGADTWAVKISSEGELEWDYTIGTEWIDNGQAILATADGGYLIASGSLIHEDAIGNISCVPHSYGWSECVLFKLDSNLNVEWQNCYGGSNHDGIYGIFELEDGYIFSAYTASNDGDVTGYHGDADIWIVKINFDGAIIWENCFGGYNGETAHHISTNSNGDYTIIGYTQSNDGDVSGNHSLFENGTDVWMFKVNNEGELISQQCFGGAGSEATPGLPFGVLKKSDNNYVIAAQTNYGPSFDVSCTPHGGLYDKDWWVFEIKDCTQYMPTTPQPPTGPDTLCHTMDSISAYQIVGDSTAWGYNWLLEPAEVGTITADSLQALVHWNSGYQGPATIRAASWNDCGESEWSQAKTSMVYSCVGLQAQQDESVMLRVYPNPATDYVIFEIIGKTGTIDALLEIHDIFGRNQATKQITSAKTVLDLRQFKQGIYFYKMELEDHHYSGKIIVQR